MYLFVLAAVIPLGTLLYFFPTATSTYWAWVIPDPRSAILIGAGYFGSIFIILWALRKNDWSEVQAGQGAFFIFLIVLLVATMPDWDKFRPYHPTTFIWLIIYYLGPLLVPIVYRLQTLRGQVESPGGQELSPAWSAWLIVRGLFYLALVPAVLLFADPISASWPWPVQPLELRVFMGQVGIVGWCAVLVLKYGRAWLRNRVEFVSTLVLGVVQLAGLFINSTSYNVSSLLGILLPAMFVEWIATSLALLFIYRHAVRE